MGREQMDHGNGNVGEIAREAEYVVALGASAGGLQVLRPIVRNLAPDGRSAYVIVHHLAPDHVSNLVELLQQHSRMPVSWLADGELVAANRIYVCPPASELEFGRRCFKLLPRAAGSLISPSIDRLFTSLAAAYGDKAIAVVLSGSGTDGRAGARAVQEAGGIVVAQSPEKALQPGMPEAVIRAGTASLVGDAGQISGWLSDVHSIERSPWTVGGRLDEPYDEVIRRVSEQTGLDAGCYKEGTLRRQIVRRYRSLGFASLEEYLLRLDGDTDEIRQLQQSFLISVSSFFRDEAAFTALTEELRRVAGEKSAGDSLRVWVPGCATGEEVYSIAILLAEILGERLAAIDARIFATDIDQDALDLARAGLYTADDLAAVDPQRRERWFTAESGGWRVAKTIRGMCTFANHNVIAHPPFMNLDLISCRNLLIYFKPEQQNELMATFHYGLKHGGLLLLGNSESPGFQSRLFEAIGRQQRLYRRLSASVSHAPRFAPLATGLQRERARLTRPDVTLQRRSLVDAALGMLARRYGPPAVLLNAAFEPLHFFGQSQRYFRIPEESFDFSLFNLCMPELRSELKALCYRLTQERQSTLEGSTVQIAVGGRLERLQPSVHRVEPLAEGGDYGVLVIFDEADRPAPALLPEWPPNEAALENTEILRLRQELADSREHLQAVIEELEASNEELQSLNEELQSSSEELQAANEELQSSNEELTTLNEELRIKSQEAIELTNTLTNIQNSMSSSLLVVDEEGHITRYNALATRVFGIVSRDIGQSLYGVPCHLNLPQLRAQVGQVVNTGASIVERVHQGNFHFLMQIDAYQNELGRRVGAVLTFTDISELYRVEQAHAESENRFRQVWEASLDGLMVVDESGVITMVNPGLARMFGYQPEALLGQKVEMLVPEMLRERHEANRAAFFALPEAERMMHLRDLTGVRRDGSEFFVEISLSGMMLGGLSNVVASVNDITERKQAELELARHRANLERLVVERTREIEDVNHALVAKEKFIRTVTDAMPSMIGYWDADKRCRFANATYREWFGRSPEEMLGMRIEDLLGPAVYAKNEPYISGVLGGEAQHFERTLVKVDGSTGYVLASYIPDFKDGQVCGFFVMVNDVTQLKLAELQLDALNEELDRRARQAESAAKLKSAFLANMSHEIRTPMNAIVGMAQLMRHAGLPPEQAERLFKLEAAGEHLLGIINAILELSKIEAGKFELLEADVDVGNLVGNVVALLSDAAAAKGIALRSEIGALPPHLKGDQTRLQEALLNYASNAVKFTDSGSVVFRCRLLGETNSQVTIRFEVEDTGIGIDPEVLSRLFSAFEQADNSTTRKYGGTGLGLAITKKIAELMDGEVGAHSIPGQGSTFWFTARLKKGTESSPPVPVPVRPSDLLLKRDFAGARILIVEDEPINQEIAQCFLEEVGMVADLAGDGIEALKCAEKNVYALILMDMQMPNLDGLDTTRLIRQFPQFARTPIIAMTANAFLEDRKRCLEAGMNDFITKPVQAETLYAVLLKWLSAIPSPAI